MNLKLRIAGIGILCAIVAILGAVLLADSFGDTETVKERDIEKVTALTNRQASFDDFVELFTEVANDKGGAYAFDLMRVSPLPFGLDQHLLGHEIGDLLYTQEGIEGMGICTHEFRNACSHTMVIGALLEFGEGALPRIRDACFNAPGGSGAYAMCFHGLGHGVLAFNGYEMKKTVALCDKLGTPEYEDREAIECFGGAIMEIIGGGGHDPENWQLRRDEYLDPEEPFGLCASDIVPGEFKPICYIYMTPFAFEASGADMGNPGPAAYKKTFEWCAEIPASEIENRGACFGGVGKELIGFAIGRNFALDVPPENQLATMYEWCMLAGPQDGKEQCVASVVSSLYWGGEKPYQAITNFCALVDNPLIADDCYRSGIQNVLSYNTDPAYRAEFCEALPDSWHSECTNVLGVLSL